MGDGADVRAQPGSEPVNALVGAPKNSSILDNVVKGDSLTTFVTVGGMRMHGTQSGNQVVPRFTVLNAGVGLVSAGSNCFSRSSQPPWINLRRERDRPTRNRLWPLCLPSTPTYVE